VDLPPRLGDASASAEYGLTIARSKADFSLRDNRVLVLAGMEMGQNESADRERVLNNRYLAVCVPSPELEGDTKPE
jgi:hypothetical protein